METKFNFKSQICTTRSQSEALLKLGLKKETADMIYYQHWENAVQKKHNVDVLSEYNIPAWSLHGLIVLMPDIIKDHIDEMLYHLSIDGNSVFYENRSFDLCQFFGDNLYVCIIDCIEWLIKEGYFNKEYLEE
jgi:hypothetical protein